MPEPFNALSRRTFIGGAAVAGATALAFPSTALGVSAAEKQAEADAVRNQLVGLQADLEAAAENFYTAEAERDAAKQAMEAEQAKIDLANQEIADLQSRLGLRARSMYRSGSATFLDFLMGATSFAEFTQNWDLLNGLNESDAEMVAQTKDLRAQVEALPLSIDLEALCDGSPRWLVFTSANGVRVFFDALHGQKIDLRRLAACRFAVIGPATGDALSDRGILPDLCRETYTSAALADALAERMKAEGETGEAVLLRSRKGAKILPETLRAAGFAVRDVPLYDVRAILPAEGSPALEEGALPWKLDYLLFSSAGGVEQFFAQYGAVPEGTVCACIGEVTARQLKKHAAKDSGRPAPYTGNILTAREATAQALAEAVIRDAQEQACQKRANMF